MGKLHAALEVSKSMGVQVIHLLGSQASLTPTPVDELRAALEVSSPSEQSGLSAPHSPQALEVSKSMGVPVIHLLGSQASLTPTPVDEW